ncbi:uncharacterized protein LOC117321907 [Pecten maximus]|uniref:uncharacterized protein LOC117321907 n=1 Tax=Pecten maximus TaxID=6579 RepID=UPI001458CC29|nr:uncharacterized protein LOC117321907 [Pecten maximus]
MSLFCEDHQVLVCSLCVAISHRACCNVLMPSEYAEKLNSDNVIRTRLVEGELAMDALVRDFTIQLEILESNKHEAEHLISGESKKLENIVSQLRDQSMCELTRLYKAQKEHLETSIQRCKSLKNSMINTNKVSTVVSCGTDSVQKISIYQRGKAEINSCAEVIRDLVRPFEGKVINFEPECLSEKFETVTTMVKMSMANQIRELPAALDNWLPLSERVVKHHGTVTVKLDADKCECSIRDVMWYKDDIILLTDANNKSVKLFTENGELIDVLHMTDRPWAVSKLSDNRVAVTRPDAKIISVIKVEETIAERAHERSSEVDQDTAENSSNSEGRENDRTSSQKKKKAMSVEKDIIIDRHCYGICHVGDKFLVNNGKASPYQLYSVESDGRTDLIVEHESPSYYITRAITQNDVLVSLTSSIPGNAALYRMSSVGPHGRTNLSPAGGNSLNNVYGLDVDREGNVYLCCGGVPGVVQLTPHGATVRELVGAEHGVKDPRAVAVVNNKVVVADVCKANANTIKIFHLR